MPEAKICKCKEELATYQDWLANALFDLCIRSKQEFIKHSVDGLGEAIKNIGECLGIIDSKDFKRAIRNWELFKQATEKKNFGRASFELASTISVLARGIKEVCESSG